MILISEEIREMLKDKWSGLTDDRIWPRGKKYKIISMARLLDVVDKCSIKGKYKWLDEGWECESFSTMLQAAVLDYQYNEEVSIHSYKSYTPWFFAIAIGLRFRGQDGNHNINLAITDKGIVLIEPMDDSIWLADSDKDNPYFIFR